MRACELAQLLAQDAESIAKMLLPNGRRVGKEWVVGDTEGGAGESLKVHLDGSKAGVWKDFATDQAGDMVGLWMQVNRMDLRIACQEISQHLGIKSEPLPAPRHSFSRPSREDVKPVTEIVSQWLSSVRRIGMEAMDAYKVRSKKGALMFPYFRDGELIAAKYRAVPEKKFWTDADCEPSLFGWQAIPADSREITICEGELDALSLFQYSRPALSVPFGGGTGDKQSWIENEYERLSVYDTIYLCLDQDGPGESATAEIVKRLGRERCRVVKLPHKDANECLQKGIAQEVIEQCFVKAKTVDPDRLHSAAEYEESVVREFSMLKDGEVGIRLPWSKVGDSLILRPGEVSIWAGINGHGKTEVVSNIALEFISQSGRACVCPLEFRPEKWLRRIVRQTAATPEPTVAHIRHIMHKLDGLLWVYQCTGTAKSSEMVEVFKYAAKRYRVELFVVDNLAKCGFAEDDYNGQKGFVDVLSDFARDFGVHVILVAHMRKPHAGEDKPPEKHDVKGTGALTDMVATVVTVWRNKPKERRAYAGEIVADTEPDCVLVCTKQNNGEQEPTIKLWFDRKSHRYIEEARLVVMPMIGLQSVG